MQIHFDKVGHTPKSLEIKSGDITMNFMLKKLNHHRVGLDGELNGTIDLVCDRCGKSITETISQPIELILSQKVIEEKENLDIIEFLDGNIDLDYILSSEIEAITCSYNYCDECDGSEDFEIEF